MAESAYQKDNGKRYEAGEGVFSVIELHQGFSYIQIRQQVGDGRLKETFLNTE